MNFTQFVKFIKFSTVKLLCSPVVVPQGDKDYKVKYTVDTTELLNDKSYAIGMVARIIQRPGDDGDQFPNMLQDTLPIGITSYTILIFYPRLEKGGGVDYFE